MSLKQVTALISGGASGLGAATASYLVKNGARVVVADLNRDAFLRVEGASSSNNHDSPLKFAKVDVMKESEITAALDLAEYEFGEEVNVAINCAGIAPARKTLALKKSEDGEVTYRMHPLTEFINAINVNTIGSFNVARLAANRMARRSKDDDGLRGCIINTASVAAYDGQVGQVAYSASKGAIVGMTLPMARDLAPLGIRVMTVVRIFHQFSHFIQLKLQE